VEVSLDEGPPRAFLLDTGSPATLLSPSSYGLEEGIHRPASVGMLGITVLEPTIGALELFAGELSISGILGGDLLRRFALTLDYRDALALLWVDLKGGVPAHGEGLEEATQVSLSLLGGGYLSLSSTERLLVPATRLVVPILVEGEEILAVVDTGASMLVLDEDLLDSLLASRPTRPRLLGLEVITADGARPAEISRAARVTLEDAEGPAELASVSFLSVRGSTALAGLSAEVGRKVEALLGGSYLRSFQVTLDYPARRLTLQRYAEPTHIHPREWISVGFTFAQVAIGHVVVEALFQGSDAEDRGVSPGDRILSAGGRDITSLGAAAVQAAVDASELGDRVPFTFARGASTYDASVLIEDLLPEFN
jgi:hypothetical protein